MNIEPKLELIALSTNDWPGMPMVWATPGVSRTIFSILAITSLGSLRGRRVGKLDVDDQITLVLAGNEAGRARA